MDNVFVTKVPYGATRQDVCNAFPGRQGCPYVGYNMLWNSRTAANGQHQIKLKTCDVDAPAHCTMSNPVTITVAN